MPRFVILEHDWPTRHWDFFLESGDAHVTFYATLGWLAAVLPFSAAAWCGRVLTWAALAWVVAGGLRGEGARRRGHRRVSSPRVRTR